jgi:hypothetical protein
VTPAQRKRVLASLRRYGYAERGDRAGGGDPRRASSALRDFQRRHGLSRDGILDAETRGFLRLQRCGVPDRPPRGRATLRAAASAGWPTRELRYAFLNHQSGLSRDQTQAAFVAAFGLWAAALGLSFVSAAGNAAPHIRIGWFDGDHGDGKLRAFRGVGARDWGHAFYPPPDGQDWAGQIHLNAAERWSTSGALDAGDLVSLALHEIGHTLGLEHAPAGHDSDAMYAYFAPGELRRTLAPGDLAAATRLYPALA